MNILVLNGSPKGKFSVTLQTVNYLAKRFPSCAFDVLNVGQQIKLFEKDMSKACEKLKACDLILFCYPVYTFYAPYQLHRFISLLKAQNLDLSSKFATQISTSKHFYDATAHRYIEDNCGDLHLKYIRGLSADMDDLLTKKGQDDADIFWSFVLDCFQNNIFDTRKTLTISAKPSTIYAKCLPVTQKTGNGTVVVVTNCKKDDTNLNNMIQDFTSASNYNCNVVNIADYPFAGGCLGCFSCATTGKCIYKDNFDEFLRTKIQVATAIIYAFTIDDHSMGASFKIFDDRQFCNGHRMVTMGMPIGYIISGNYAAETNLQVVIEGRNQVGNTFLSYVATDEADTAYDLQQLATRLDKAIVNKTMLPQNFYGVGGTKIFRDLIYVMQGLMKADHKFYKEHGIYDFPQKKRLTIIKMKMVGALMSIKSINGKMKGMMNTAIITPYQKILDKTLPLSKS